MNLQIVTANNIIVSCQGPTLPLNLNQNVRVKSKVQRDQGAYILQNWLAQPVCQYVMPSPYYDQKINNRITLQRKMHAGDA